MYKEKMILNSIEKFCMRSMMDNLSNFVEQILIFQTNKTQNQILVKLNIWRKDSKNIWEYCNYGIVTETMINSVIYLGIFYKVCRSQRITTVRNASFLLIVRMTVVSSYWNSIWMSFRKQLQNQVVEGQVALNPSNCLVKRKRRQFKRGSFSNYHFMVVWKKTVFWRKGVKWKHIWIAKNWLYQFLYN